jgi:hypothetical protein
VPEALDANIMPRIGQESVWWGFQWIVTNFVVLAALVGLVVYSLEDCTDKK